MKIHPKQNTSPLQIEAVKLKTYLKKRCGLMQSPSLKARKRALGEQALQVISDNSTDTKTKLDQIMPIFKGATVLEKVMVPSLKGCPGGELGERLMMIRYLLEPLSKYATSFRLAQIANGKRDPIGLTPLESHPEAKMQLGKLIARQVNNRNNYELDWIDLF